MNLYIKSASEHSYFRLDHIGSRDSNEHFGCTSLSDLQVKLQEFGLPLELANFDSIENLPEWINQEVLPNGTVENTYHAWKASVRR